MASGLIVALARWYGALIPTDVLVKWAKNNPPNGPWVVARFLPIRQSTLPENVRALLVAFREDQNLKSQLTANLYSGVFAGPISKRTEANLELVRGWAEDPSPEVRNWAVELQRELEKELARHKMFEEEEQE